MSLPPDPRSSTETGASSPWRTLALGCGVGCLGLVAICIVGGLAVVRWATSPTALPSTRAFLTPDVSAYIEATLDRADPDAEAFLDFLTHESAKDDRKHVLSATPASVVVVAVGDPPRLAAVVSLTRFMNWVRIPMLFVGRVGDEAVVKYRREKIVHDKDELVAAAFVAGSMILGSDVDATKFVIDRMKDRDGGEAAAGFDELWAEAAPGSIRGAAANDAGQLLKVLDLLKGWQLIGDLVPDPTARAMVARLRSAVLTARFGQPTAGTIGGELWLNLPEAREVDADVVRALLARVATVLAKEKAELEARVRVDEGRLTVGFEVRLDPKLLRDRDFHVGPVKVEQAAEPR